MKELIVPIFALTALFIVPAIIGLVAIFKWFKSRDRLYKTIDDAIANRAPPEVIAQLVSLTESKENKEDKSSPVKHCSDGIFFVALGIAFSVLHYLGLNSKLIYPAVLCTMLGLADLFIGAFIAKDKKTKGE